MATTEPVIDHYLRHGLDVYRHSASVAYETILNIAEIDDYVMRKVNEMPQHPNQEAINDLIIGLAAYLFGRYRIKVEAFLNDQIRDFAQTEEDWQTRSIEHFTDKEPRSIPIGALIALSLASKIDNKSLSSYITGLAPDKAQRIQIAIRNGYVEGKSSSDVANDVQAAINIANNNAKTVARTSILHTAAVLRDAILGVNAATVSGIVWSSVLDNRTTIHICAPRDGKRYDLQHNPIGHEYSWHGGPGNAHMHCRSVGIPDYIYINETGRRTAISAGDNYEKGDNTYKNGTVRPATPGNIKAGIYKVEQVNKKTKYEDWLIRQPADFQDDILGKQKGLMFRRGDFTLSYYSTP